MTTGMPAPPLVWPDWRFRLVYAVDAALHTIIPSGMEFGPLCNLERRMWWARYEQRYPDTLEVISGGQRIPLWRRLLWMIRGH